MSQNHAVEEGNVYIQQLTVAFPVGKGDIIEYSYSLQLGHVHYMSSTLVIL